MARDPESLAAFLGEVTVAGGGDARLDRAIDGLHAELADLERIEARARRIVERMALVLQGALLVRHAPHAVAGAFCGSRLDGGGGLAFGALPSGTDHAAIVRRATPLLA